MTKKINEEMTVGSVMGGLSLGSSFATELLNGILASAAELGKDVVDAQIGSAALVGVDATGAGDKIKAGIDKMKEILPKSKRELDRKTETAALGFIETIPPEALKAAFLPVLMSLINEGKVPDSYAEPNKKAAASDAKECLILINDYRQARNAWKSGSGSRDEKNSTAWFVKSMLTHRLAAVCLKLELPEEAWVDLARDHALWQVRDKIAQVAEFAEMAVAEVIMILDLADVVRFAKRDAETKKYMRMLLDNVIIGSKSISKVPLNQRDSAGVPRFVWNQGKVSIYKEKEETEETPVSEPEPEEDPNTIDQRVVPVSEQIMENYIMKNTNDVLVEFSLRTPFKNTKQNKQQKIRLKKLLKSKLSEPNGPWFDFFRTMRFENETDRSFTALFLARQGLSQEDVESEFSRRKATKRLKTGFSPDRGDPDQVFKKYDKAQLDKLFAFYGGYVLDQIDFDSSGNLTLEFEWNEGVEAMVGNAETGADYAMSMQARNAKGAVWDGPDPDMIKRLKAANPRAKIRGRMRKAKLAGAPPGSTNEGIMDFFKKDKSQTAEEFFEVDRMGSKGAKGLIIKMLDVMTPDANIEYKGSGREEGDAVGYVQDYIKSSFLGKIDSDPGRSDNENADFAKYMDSAAWGENINFDTLVEAAKELYEYASDFFDERQTGETTESRQATIVTLGVNTIPAVLLFHCLKYLGKSLFKMRKRYNNKRSAEPMSESILQEYIMQNTPQQPEDVSIIEIIADEVNETLNNLPEVQLASEILSEDELKDLFSPLAKQAVTKVRGQIEEEIKKLVELQVNAAQLKDAVAQRIQTRGVDSITDAEKEVLLSYFTQDELEAAGIEFEVTDVEGTGAAEEI